MMSEEIKLELDPKVPTLDTTSLHTAAPLTAPLSNTQVDQGEAPEVHYMDDVNLTEEEQKALENDLLAFLRAVNPEQAEKVKHIYQYSESWMDDQRYVYFTFWQDERGHDNYSDHVGDIVVEISPIVRIVHFTFGSDSLGFGNG